jgi:hypothetical protein
MSAGYLAISVTERTYEAVGQLARRGARSMAAVVDGLIVNYLDAPPEQRLPPVLPPVPPGSTEIEREHAARVCRVCEAPLPMREGGGRRRVYCSDVCKSNAHNGRWQTISLVAGLYDELQAEASELGVPLRRYVEILINEARQVRARARARGGKR